MSSFFKNPTVQIVLGYFPNITTILLAVISFALGMVWAYGIAPVQYVNGDPSQLEQSFQNQWVAGAAGRYAARNADNAGNVLGMLQAVDDPQGIVQELQADPAYSAIADALSRQEFQQLVQQAQPEAAAPPPQPNAINNYVVPIVVILVFAILLILGKALWTLLVWPFLEPRWAQITGQGRDTSASKEIDLIKQRNQAMANMQGTAIEANQYGDPIIRQLSMYREGFGNYDDSFNIETEDKTYYGETGGTIAEEIDGEGVTAIEVWMFDKDEFANTPTVIFATEYAYNDAAMRSRLENRGEVVKMEPGTKAVLETGGLYIEATVREVNYDESATQPQSVVEESSIEIVAWAKNGADSGGAPTPMPSMETTPAAPVSTPTGAEFPAAPSGESPSEPKPLTPPPLNMPDDDDDDSLRPPSMGGSNPPPEDPFAGAGDFTPVNPNQS